MQTVSNDEQTITNAIRINNDCALPKIFSVIYFATFKGLDEDLRQEAIIMKKFFKENAAILLFSTGLFGASLVIGLFFLYGLEKIF